MGAGVLLGILHAMFIIFAVPLNFLDTTTFLCAQFIIGERQRTRFHSLAVYQNRSNTHNWFMVINNF